MQVKVKEEKMDEEEEQEAAKKQEEETKMEIKKEEDVEEEKSDPPEAAGKRQREPEKGRLVMTVNGEQKQLSFSPTDLLTMATMLVGDKVSTIRRLRAPQLWRDD